MIRAASTTSVIGYLITEDPTPPPPSDPRWSDRPPVSYSGQGSLTLYPWVKDSSGRVSSAVAGKPVSLNQPIVNIKPSVGTFSAPPAATASRIPITAFTAVAGDNPVKWFMVTESPAVPSALDGRWCTEPPTEYVTKGSGELHLYPWVKDSANVVSDVANPITVSLSFAPPLLEQFKNMSSFPGNGDAGYWEGVLPFAHEGVISAGRSPDTKSILMKMYTGDEERSSITITFPAPLPDGEMSFWYKLPWNSYYATIQIFFDNHEVYNRGSNIVAPDWVGMLKPIRFLAGTRKVTISLSSYDALLYLTDIQWRFYK